MRYVQAREVPVKARFSLECVIHRRDASVVDFAADVSADVCNATGWITSDTDFCQIRRRVYLCIQILLSFRSFVQMLKVVRKVGAPGNMNGRSNRANCAANYCAGYRAMRGAAQGIVNDIVRPPTIVRPDHQLSHYTKRRARQRPVRSGNQRRMSYYCYHGQQRKHVQFPFVASINAIFTLYVKIFASNHPTNWGYSGSTPAKSFTKVAPRQHDASSLFRHTTELHAEKTLQSSGIGLATAG